MQRVISFSVIIFFRLVSALKFSIGGIFHTDWQTFRPSDSLSLNNCFTQCYGVCVSYNFTVYGAADFKTKLQHLSSEKHDIIIVGEPSASTGKAPAQRLTILNPYYSQYTSTSSSKRFLGRNNTVSEKGDVGHEIKKFISRFLSAVKPGTIIVFHDDATALYVGDLLDYLSDTGVGTGALVFSSTGLQTKAQMNQVLTQIHESFYSKGIYVVLLGAPDFVLTTMGVVNSFDDESNRTTNFRHLSHWLILTDVDSANIYLPVVDELENVVLVDIHTHRPVKHLQDVIDYLQVTVERYFAKTSEVHGCTHFDVSKTNLTRHVMNVLDTIHKQLALFSLYGVGKFSRFNTIADYEGCDTSQLEDKIFPNKKYKWNGVHLLVSTKPWPGYVERVSHGNHTSYGGMCVEMLKSMADTLNFTYTIEEVPDGEWGGLVNGSWTGLVRQLQDRAIDLAVADITIHSIRDTVMDYVYPYFKTEAIDILYRLPDNSDTSFDTLTTPLKPLVVPVIAGSLCLVTLLYMILEYVDELVKLRCRPWHMGGLFWNILWYMIGSLLSQGGSVSPRSCSGRLLMASWWLFCITFAATYSATLTVSFCVQRTVVPFTSLQEMVHHSDYKWGMFNGSINMVIFGTSRTPLYQTTYRKMMEFAQLDPSILNKDLNKQLDKVVKEKYAFIAGAGTLNTMIERAPRGVILTTLGESLYPSKIALGVPSNSPLLPEFQRVMGNLKETGILQHWLGQFWNRPQPRTEPFQLGGDPLPLTKLIYAFCLVGFGVCLALSVLVCETVTKHLHTKRKNRKQCMEEQN